MIGVFDSGVGGLTVLKSFLQALPQYDYLYLGDNARAPYGDKDQETIYHSTKQCVAWLIGQGCSLIILACNTASADALRHLQADHLGQPVRILGVTIPLAKAAARQARGRVGVLATRSTVASGSYPREVHKINPALTVVQVAAPLLVPLIEENMERKPLTQRVIKGYVRQLTSQRVEDIILGCTHYEFIRERIQRYAGSKIKVLDSGTIIADSLVDYLSRHLEIREQLTTDRQRRYVTTGDAGRFEKSAVKFLGQLIKAEKIEL